DGNVTMGLGMEPEEAISLLAQAAMRLAAEYGMPSCNCPPGTHDDDLQEVRESVAGFDRVITDVIAPRNDASGLAASLRRARELAEGKDPS
ncbi:MAG TPA: hypothetical protein VH084_29990, partial [Mycobacterium sp.]|nr:hypothetical protein [Mycobacterium sp.]